MDRFLISFGYIPENCSSELISCGDPDSYGSKSEIVYYMPELGDNNLYDLYTDKVVAEVDNLFSTPSTVADFIAGEIKGAFNFDIAPEEICLSWAFFQEELFAEEIQDSKLELVESEFGEFSNENNAHNGKLFFRFIYEGGDGEIYQENMVLIAK
jgi:hypothetical protein